MTQQTKEAWPDNDHLLGMFEHEALIMRSQPTRQPHLRRLQGAE